MSREQDIRDRMVELAQRVLQRTLESKIRWVDTDNDYQYLYSASTSGVTIERFENQYEGTHYQLTLLNSDGRSVQELTSTTFEGNSGVSEDAPWNEVLERLFDAARREALGIDALLDQTLQDVDQGISKPKTKPRFGGTRQTGGNFDDPWATAAPAKPATAFDEDPPF